VGFIDSSKERGDLVVFTLSEVSGGGWLGLTTKFKGSLGGGDSSFDVEKALG
jgi:hypothetical protein